MTPPADARLVVVLAVVVLAGAAAVPATAREAPPPSAVPGAGGDGAPDDDSTDPALWGRLFPEQYELYLKTVDMVRTRYGGSEAVPRTLADNASPSVAARSKIDEDARLKTMWSGYAFAVDFREERGHAYMLEDQTLTKRQDVAKQPGTCLHCHASVYVPYKKLGQGDLIRGFEAMNQLPFFEARKLVEHPVACIDCHDPADMSLRVTRPGFIEGIRALKAREGVDDYDVNRQASQKEMRAYVCGQCHVEYYFKGPEKRLVYPWANGVRIEEIQKYYDDRGFKDWVHKDTGAAVLKAQHPEFEVWSQGIHARSGVTCVDCHMPPAELAGATVTDHWVRSPLLNAKASCLCCHEWSEAEMRSRAEQIQDRFHGLRNQALDALTQLIGDLKSAKEAGRPDADLAAARYLQRRAQFYLDFVEAENSTGFHAPGEELRILGQAIDWARQGQIALRDPAFRPTVAIVAIPVEAPAVPK